MNMIVEVIPVIIGALRTARRNLKEHLGKIGIEIKIVELQKLLSFILQGFSEKFFNCEVSC